MSEQYYAKEDVLPNTPDQVIENIQAQSNSLANVVPEVATALNQTGEALGILYQNAEAKQDLGAMALISAAWQRTEMIANQTVQLDALKQSALDAIATINEERLRVTEQLSDIEEAIAEGDEQHDLLHDYAQEIRRDEAEAAMEQAGEYALEYAHEVTYDNLSETLSYLTGLKWQQVNRFIGILQGDYVMSEVNRARLKELIESLDMERDGAE